MRPQARCSFESASVAPKAQAKSFAVVKLLLRVYFASLLGHCPFWGFRMAIETWPLVSIPHILACWWHLLAVDGVLLASTKARVC
jgi:hypothetical protein